MLKSIIFLGDFFLSEMSDNYDCCPLKAILLLGLSCFVALVCEVYIGVST